MLLGQPIELPIKPVQHLHHLRRGLLGRYVGEAYNVREKDGDALVVLGLDLLPFAKRARNVGRKHLLQQLSSRFLLVRNAQARGLLEFPLNCCQPVVHLVSGQAGNHSLHSGQLETARRVCVPALHNQLLHLRRHSLGYGGAQVGLTSRSQPVENIHNVLALVGVLARKDFVHGHAKGKDVRLRGRPRLLGKQLRSHPERSAELPALAREDDPNVGELWGEAAAHKHVGGLEIHVQHGRVRRVQKHQPAHQPLENLGHNVAVQLHSGVLQQTVQVTLRHALHDHQRFLPSLHHSAHNRDDVRMAQLHHNLYLLGKRPSGRDGARNSGFNIQLLVETRPTTPQPTPPGL
mmetsp:Transcript_43012/g.82066  ORF Transcript_43012/g.82066 Transcript_43012/m.82066 type:complete len:348 (-) Transcript_43012:2587-3630(-)